MLQLQRGKTRLRPVCVTLTQVYMLNVMTALQVASCYIHVLHESARLQQDKKSLVVVCHWNLTEVLTACKYVLNSGLHNRQRLTHGG